MVQYLYDLYDYYLARGGISDSCLSVLYFNFNISLKRSKSGELVRNERPKTNDLLVDPLCPIDSSD